MDVMGFTTIETIKCDKPVVYTGRIDILPENPEPYMTKNGTKIFQCWDFNKSEIKKWLDENCSEEWFYSWGDENDDETMTAHISFSDEIDVMAFRLKWE